MKRISMKYLFVFIIALIATTFDQQIAYATDKTIVIPAQLKELSISDDIDIYILIKNIYLKKTCSSN